jgi:HNH endonuclease
MVTRKRVEPNQARLDRVVADARRAKEERDKSYRGRALKMFPWICGRCAREFDHTNVHELTVHHKNHDHDHNPPDGSNWELLCLYCHDNEHQRQLDPRLGSPGRDTSDAPGATQSPFAELASLMKKEKPSPE